LEAPQPDFIASFTNNFSYKNWNLNVDMYSRWGGTVLVNTFVPANEIRYNRIDIDYWTPTNPTNDYPRPSKAYRSYLGSGSPLGYRDASYIQLRKVTLSYNLPESLLNNTGISKVQIYASGRNLFYWTKSDLSKDNIKPLTSGMQLSAYPALRTYIFGIHINF
jgi:hypothetical protein